MFKSNRVILALAALSLAACNSTPSDNAGNEPETYTVKCNQSGTMVLDVQATRAYSYKGGVRGTTINGDNFTVQGSACIISKNKVKPNVATN